MLEKTQGNLNFRAVQPVQPGERIKIVDILRGFAIFGILAANMASYSGHEANLVAAVATIDRYVLIAIRFLITAKFYSLFSFLFGWGMAVQMSRAEQQGRNFTEQYLRRLLILLLFGLLHAVFIWDGDILTTYAMLGVLLFLIRKRSERTIIIATILCLLLSILLTAPWELVEKFVSWYEERTAFMHLDLAQSYAYRSGSYYEITRLRIEEFLGITSRTLFFFGNVFSMFLLGLYVGKRKILHEVESNLGLIRKVLVGGFVLGVVCNAYVVWMTLHPEWMPANWLPGSYQRMLQRAFYTIGAPAMMLFYASGITLLYRIPYWRSQLAPLANAGRMALSNYISQSLIGTFLFYNYGLGLYGEISPTIGLILTVMIFVFQIRISEWWFDRYRYGLLEWIWRALTYGSSLKVGRETPVVPARERWPGKLFEVLRRIPPGSALAGTWVMLVIWGSVLYAWNLRLEARSQAPSLRLVSRSSTSSMDNESATGEEAQTGETGAQEDQLPSWSQVPYRPGLIAASGDMEALAATFDIDQALRQIKTLTGPPYLGRQAGSPAGNAVAEYIAEQFKSYGLQPLGDQGSYFQEFPVLYTPLASTPRLYAETDTGTLIRNYVAYQDFSAIVRYYAGSGSGEGHAYWANQCADDDLKGFDMSGKVLLCLAGSEPNWLIQMTRRSLEHGASALLILNDPDAWPPDFGWDFKEIWVPEPLPVFYVYPEMLADLLAGSQISVDDLLYGTSPFQINKVIGFELKTLEGSTCPGIACPAKNVLGILPGRDPKYADEAIILGAHFDHMGEAPNGIVWAGANDNASGVAVLLEIARSWQEQGFVPKRSVIFAAWDAEEKGLLGAQHYVENPPFPLEKTIAMIQLDMVGVGIKTVGIDGPPQPGNQIKYVAEIMGTKTESSNFGRSDHVPFLEAGVPASALYWVTEEGGPISYHRPLDTIESIEPSQLQRAAEITNLAALGLVESEPGILELLDSRAQAALEGDLGAFLASSTTDQIQNDLYWYNDLQAFQPIAVEIEAEDLRVAGNFANAEARIQVSYIEPTELTTRTLSANMPVSLVNNGIEGWQWAGPELVREEGTTSDPGDIKFALAYPEGEAERISDLASSASNIYREVTNLLGLPTEVDAKLLVLPNQEILRASTALSLPADQFTWINQGEVRLVFTEEITTSQRLKDAMVQLALAEAGVNETLAPWLWDGMPLAMQSYFETVATQVEHLPRLHNAFSGGTPLVKSDRAWAATQFFQERLGWAGMGEFITALGEACQSGCNEQELLDSTLTTFTGMNESEFETTWQEAWMDRLAEAQRKLDEALAKRSQAILGDDLLALLNTIDRNVPNFETEESHWLEEWISSSATNFILQGHPIAFLEDGRLLAEIDMTYLLKDEASGESELSSTFVTSFTPGESGYQWAGPQMEIYTSELIDVLYPPGMDQLAEYFIEQGGLITSELSEQLGIEQAKKITIKLYRTQEALRASIPINHHIDPSEPAWTGAGESLKLFVGEGRIPEGSEFLLAKLLSRNLLHQMSINENWLLDGASAHLARPYQSGNNAGYIYENYPLLFDSAMNNTLSRLGALPALSQLAGDELMRARTQVWDAVDYLISIHGWEIFLELAGEFRNGTSAEQAFQRTFGMTIDQFEQAWRDSLLRKHSEEKWLETAYKFSVERAMESVKSLASPEFMGRQAGSIGGEKAMEYIAEKFLSYGLVPSGEQINETLSLPGIPEQPLTGIPESSITQNYFQTFPISYTQISSLPELELVDNEGAPAIQFIFREDFNVIQEGIVSSALVWGGTTEYTRTDLEGKIILRTARGNLEEEIDAAARHGAGGLILAGIKYEPNEVYGKQLETAIITTTTSIPVIELTQAGYSKLLEALGHDRQSIAKLPLYQALEREVRFANLRPKARTVLSANVLGYLPGSDPYLRKEVIILGAHYDHVGDDPGGYRYSGANDNASGVAVLLEIARLLHENKIQPKRSILLAAWGAQELGQVGSEFYLENPSFPLQETIAVIQLDGVGGGDGFNLGVQGLEQAARNLFFYLSAAEAGLEEKLVYTNPLVQSDHVPFQREEIPAVLISWRLANENNLPDEFANAVRPERLEVTGQVVTMLLLALAR